MLFRSQQTLQKCKDPKRLHKQLYANKMDNLEEIDKFLERYNIPRVNQEEIEYMNRPIISTEIETVLKKIGRASCRERV